MARLPQPGGDSGNWGDILNDYLATSHKSDGTIKDNSIGSAQLQDNAVTATTLAPNSVTSAALASDSVTAATIADGSITEPLLASAVQTKLNTPATIADGSVTDTKIAADAISKSQLQSALRDEIDGKLTKAVADGSYAPIGSVSSGSQRSDVMAAIRHRLATNQDVTWTHLGDSTANGDDEWLKIALGKFKLDYPNIRVTHELWNDTTKAYDAAVLQQEGTGDGMVPAPEALALTSGKKPYAARDDNGGVRITLDFTFAAKASGEADGAGSRVWALHATTGNRIFCEAITSTSGLSLNLYKTIGGVSSGMVGGLSRIDRDNVATGGSARLVFEVKDRVATAFLTADGITVSKTGALTQAELDLIGLDRHYSDRSVGTGHTHTSWTAGAMASSAAGSMGTFRVINGSMPGASLAYLTTNLSAMTPTDSNLVTVATSHNHGSGQTPVQYVDAMDSYLSLVKVRTPSAAIIISSQNPKFSPELAASITAHRARLVELDSYTRQRGYGYIPAIEVFLRRSDRGAAWMNVDGIHPLQSGSTAWADEALRVFRGQTPL